MYMNSKEKPRAGVTVFVGFDSQWHHNDRNNNNHKHRYDASILNWSIEKTVGN